MKLIFSIYRTVLSATNSVTVSVHRLYLISKAQTLVYLARKRKQYRYYFNAALIYIELNAFDQARLILKNIPNSAQEMRLILARAFLKKNNHLYALTILNDLPVPQGIPLAIRRQNPRIFTNAQLLANVNDIKLENFPQLTHFFHTRFEVENLSIALAEDLLLKREHTPEVKELLCYIIVYGTLPAFRNRAACLYELHFVKAVKSADSYFQIGLSHRSDNLLLAFVHFYLITINSVAGYDANDLYQKYHEIKQALSFLSSSADGLTKNTQIIVGTILKKLHINTMISSLEQIRALNNIKQQIEDQLRILFKAIFKCGELLIQLANQLQFQNLSMCSLLLERARNNFWACQHAPDFITVMITKVSKKSQLKETERQYLHELAKEKTSKLGYLDHPHYLLFLQTKLPKMKVALNATSLLTPMLRTIIAEYTCIPLDALTQDFILKALLYEKMISSAETKIDTDHPLCRSVFC